MKFSLEELEKDYWSDNDLKNVKSTSLVKKVYSFRKIPLKDLYHEQIRLLIGQDTGIKYLLPLALDILEKNPYTECDFSPCDLLKYVTKIDIKYWTDNKELYKKFCKIMIKFNENYECENNKRDEFNKMNDKERDKINIIWNKIKLIIQNTTCSKNK